MVVEGFSAEGWRVVCNAVERFNWIGDRLGERGEVGDAAGDCGGEE